VTTFKRNPRAPLKLNTQLVYDPRVREALDDLNEHLFDQSQLHGFKFIGFSTKVAVTNLRVAHGLRAVPRDLVRLSVIGSGTVRFNYSRFTDTHIDVTTDGPVRVRMFAGTWFKSVDPVNYTDEDFEEWFAEKPESTADGDDDTDCCDELGERLDAAEDDIDALETDISGLDDRVVTLEDAEVPVYSDGLVGEIRDWPSNELPAGGEWDWCDGGALLRADYPELFAAIGTRYGIGDGTTTFNKPDRRGYFVRGADDMGSAAGAASRDPASSTRTATVAGTHTVSGTTASGNSIITGLSAADYANVAVGMSITGTGIPASSYVIAKPTSSSIQIGNGSGTAVNATGSATVTLTLSKSAMADFIGSAQSYQAGDHTHGSAVSSAVDNGDLTVLAVNNSSNNNHARQRAGVASWNATNVTSGGSVTLATGVTSGGIIRGQTATSNAATTESRPLNVSTGFIIRLVPPEAPPLAGVGSFAELQDDVDALQSDVGVLQLAMAEAQDDIVALELEVATLQTDLDAAESDIDDLEARMTAAETDIDGHQLTLTDHEDRIDLLESAVLGNGRIPGEITMWSAPASIPTGWLECDGEDVDRALYPDLFAVIGTTYGRGDGTTTFNLPDFRGRFIRGADSMGIAAPSKAAGIDVDMATRTAVVAGTWNATVSIISGSSTVTVPTFANWENMAIGMAISGTGIPANSFIGDKDDLGGGVYTISLANGSGTSVNATATNAALNATIGNSAAAFGLGSVQDDQLGTHTHGRGSYHAKILVSGTEGSVLGAFEDGSLSATRETTSTSVATVSKNLDFVTPVAGTSAAQNTPTTETRPLNVSVIFIIKT
jgi:microcystin-dependent protein